MTEKLAGTVIGIIVGVAFIATVDLMAGDMSATRVAYTNVCKVRGPATSLDIWCPDLSREIPLKDVQLKGEHHALHAGNVVVCEWDERHSPLLRIPLLPRTRTCWVV